ncbi:jg23727 [Pararge aegeria aegeria]|uniref:Jg23727 protein n=1 Tax=Pararge aegeria aegeria TaxID=348720 RepID=A0A8S4R222_9NEOP|nr:jg23727 [Pararge aegeria aegeria]
MFDDNRSKDGRCYGEPMDVWIPTCSSGNPQTQRWSTPNQSDDIAKVGGINWMQVAQDRDRWSSLEEAFTLA